MDNSQQDTSARQWLGKKPLIIGCIVILVIIGGLLWWLMKREDGVNSTLSQNLDAANAKQVTGDYEGALGGLKASEQEAKTKEEKVRLYSEIAALASSAGKLEEALQYYALKHQLDPEGKKQDGYIVGLIYERQDNPTKALEYYRLYLEYLESEPLTETSTTKIASTKETIAQLEGVQP